MLWTWQYRQMDKEMKLWCGETAGRRHAVERVSSRQPSSGPAMQTWSPWTTGPDRHVTPAVSGAQHCRQTVVRPHQADRDRWCRPGECAAERGERVVSGVVACSGVERAAVRSRRLASRGHAERYAERPDAKEMHPENDQKAARSPWSHARTCEVGRHHREHQRSTEQRRRTEQREQRRSSGATGDAPSSHPPGGPTCARSVLNAPRMRAAFAMRFFAEGGGQRPPPRAKEFQRRPPNRRGASVPQDPYLNRGQMYSSKRGN